MRTRSTIISNKLDVDVIKTALRAAWSRGPATPRRLSLRAIRWYQLNVSAGRNVCPRGPGRNCSSYGYRSIGRYGVLIGGIMTARYVASCGIIPNKDGGCDRVGDKPDCGYPTFRASDWDGC